MRLALETDLRNRWTLRDALDFAAELKLAGVILPSSATPSDLPEEGREKLRRAASDAGVAIAGLSNVLAGKTHALVGGEASRAIAQRTLEDTVRLCFDLGAKLACVELPAWDQLRGRLRLDHAQTLAAQVLRACGPLAESRRVTLCLSDAGATESFLKMIGHASVRLAADARSLAALSRPVRDVRLVRATIEDDAGALGQTLAALKYASWLALHVEGGDAAAWLRDFRRATSGGGAA